MWALQIKSPDEETRVYHLKFGKNTIGRGTDSDVVLEDTSVSRFHAVIEYSSEGDIFSICDKSSTNGTVINQKNIKTDFPYQLRAGDVIRIGMHEITLVSHESSEEWTKPTESDPYVLPKKLQTGPLTTPAGLIYKAVRELNTALNLESALQRVTGLMKRYLDADKCDVILANQFHRLQELGFSRTIANMAIEKRDAVVISQNSEDSSVSISDSAARLCIQSALCIPVMSGEKIIALIYLYKTDPQAPSFNESDLELAIAISHLSALTIERMNLLERFHDEQKVRQLLKRLLAPAEAEFLLQNYLRTGRLPELAEHDVTVLFADIAGSTRLAERLGVSRFGEILHRYYQDITDIIFQHGGLLDKYLGDGVMAVFGMTGNKKDSEGHAVQAGLAMLDLLDSKFWSKNDQIQIGVGVNTGPVVAGYVSTKERVEFAVLGDTVNVTSKLQDLARPNRLYIGPRTCQAIKDCFNTRSIGTVAIKGRKRPLQVYEVLRT